MNNDKNWEDIEFVPDGCVPIEVMYKDGRVSRCCSCDVHWYRQLKKTLPEYYRLLELGGANES